MTLTIEQAADLVISGPGDMREKIIAGIEAYIRSAEPVACRGMANIYDDDWSYDTQQVVDWEPLYAAPPATPDNVAVLERDAQVLDALIPALADGVMNCMESIRFIAQRAANIRASGQVGEPLSDTARLNFLESNYLEVSADGGWEEEPTYRVHRVTGNRNDRQWNRIGEGETLREAIDTALASVQGGE